MSGSDTKPDTTKVTDHSDKHAGAATEHVWAKAAQDAYKAPAVDQAHPLKGLKDSRIEKSPESDKGPDGHPLQKRDAGEATKLEVKVGHKDGDPPPNYTVDKSGHIKELRSPDRKLDAKDKSIIIETEGDAPTKAQLDATQQLVKAVEKSHPHLNRSQDIPKPVQQHLDPPANIPQVPPIPREQRGGNVGEPHGPKDWGGYGGNQGGNGGPRGGDYFGDGGSHLPPSPPVDWSKVPGGGLNPHNPMDRVAQLISSNEGSPTSINWNDNGCGISVGMFQANQKVGELPMLFAAVANDPEGYKELVEAFGPELAAKIKANPNIVRNLDFEKGNKLGHELQELVQKPHFQETELKLLREKVMHAADVAKQHGIESTAGVALVADMINQFGEAGASKFFAAADGAQGQEQKARAMVEAVRHGSKYGARYAGDMQKLASNGLNFDDKFYA